MWKWIFRTGRLLATAVLVSLVSVWTTGYIVHSYVETVLKQIGLPLEVQPPGLTGLWGKWWGTETQKDSGSKEKPRGFGESMAENGRAEMSEADEVRTGRAAGSQGDSDGWQGNFRGEETDFPAGEAGLPEFTPPQDGPVFSESGSHPAISEEDREALRAIMMKLNEDELLQIARLLADGWSQAEWEAAAALLQNALEPKDYKILMEILNKAAARPANSPYSAENQAF